MILKTKDGVIEVDLWHIGRSMRIQVNGWWLPLKPEAVLKVALFLDTPGLCVITTHGLSVTLLNNGKHVRLDISERGTGGSTSATLSKKGVAQLKGLLTEALSREKWIDEPGVDMSGWKPIRAEDTK